MSVQHLKTRATAGVPAVLGSNTFRSPRVANRRLATSSAPAASTQSDVKLPWSEYLSIRAGKRRWELATTIPFTAAGFVGGLGYFGTINAEGTQLIMGIEAIWVYLGATLACGGAGWLIGPTVGSSAWRLMHRRKVKLIDAREKEFHDHVVKNRVDPSRQSATNPVPDYYGENIGSLRQYRQWLRDQSRFRRKSQWPEDEQ